MLQSSSPSHPGTLPHLSVRLVSSVVLLGAALYAGSRRIGPAPALGPLLEPAHGVWSLARAAELPRDATAGVPGLGQEVKVVYDDRAVPHIFASTEEDAYRALGYVVARDRLFQLSLQTLAASGRLTEIGGARALTADREMRGLGLPRSAELRMKALGDSSDAMRFTRAYADGVNAYMREMPASALPLEFRVLGTKPEPWQAIDSYHLASRMGWTLAYLAVENDRFAAAGRVGTAAADALFPDVEPIQEPIQPNGQRAARLDFRRLPPPGLPDSLAMRAAAATEVFLPSRRLADADADGQPLTMASNNWAISPGRSANGHALLAGDPHLDLSLPSIWYEAHIVVPGRLDVYGVTIPGAPFIVIGFNRDVAWTMTNTGADVLDYFAERVDDEARPTRYLVDGVLTPLERRIEVYRGPGGAVLATDTMFYTHRGPMRRVRGRWTSMRWTVLEAGTESQAFIEASRATSAAAAAEAVSRWYKAPAQNFLMADRAGHIAVRSTGRFPIRGGDGRGNVVRDGSISINDWKGDLPVARHPQAFDPGQGFLASANQQPIDPRGVTDWWGGDYDPWRALRVNALLRANGAMTPEAMRAMQTDPGSARADLFVPFFLDGARRIIARRPSGVDLARLEEAVRLLGEWDRRYTRDNRRAVLFEEAMRELVIRTWDEFAVDTSPRRRVATPSTAILAGLLTDSASAWWDVRGTAPVERRDDVIAASLVAALEAVRTRHGDPAGEGWRWDRVRFANVHHLLRLPALSALTLPVQGGPSTVSPSSGTGTHGSSWRMVVELGPEVQAWTTYPGGQSGSPVSSRFRDRIPLWTRGELEPVRLPRSADGLTGAQTSAALVLRPVR